MCACVCAMAEDMVVTDSIPSVSVDTLGAEAPQRRVLIIDDLEHAIVHQDSSITRVLEQKVNKRGDEIVEIAGFRVQVYSSNNQQTAKAEAMRIEQNLTGKVDVPIYVQYAPPFWKVRLGNFRTQEQAQAYKIQFVKSHPELQGDTYIVRDQIQVNQ